MNYIAHCITKPLMYYIIRYEPQYGKTAKVTVCPATVAYWWVCHDFFRHQEVV